MILDGNQFFGPHKDSNTKLCVASMYYFIGLDCNLQVARSLVGSCCVCIHFFSAGCPKMEQGIEWEQEKQFEELGWFTD